MTPTLYIVATPLGNLEDISRRAIRTLAEVDVVAAEDTRRTAKLLNHLGLTKPLVSYWGAKEKIKTREVLSLLEQGKNVALVSDAGTPGISDPGRLVVAEAARCGFAVIPIPGPSALTGALSISGLPADRFLFAGFLPPKSGARRRVLEELAREPNTVVFYEAPHRMLETLVDLEDIFGGDRFVVLTRELTKLHEETLRGTVADVLDRLEESTIAGEYVLVVEGKAPGTDANIEDALGEVAHLIRRGLSRKDAVAKVGQDYGISKKKLYDGSLDAGDEA